MLKAEGARFSRELNWHFNEEKQNTIKVSVDDVCDKDDAGQYFFKYDADYIVKNLRKGV